MRRLNNFLFEGVFPSSECLGKAAALRGPSIYIMLIICLKSHMISGFLPSHYIDLVAKATHGSLMRAKFVLSLY